jgi:hypothetical protein
LGANRLSLLAPAKNASLTNIRSGAQKLWLTNRCPPEWREKVNVSHDAEPEQTSDQVSADLIQFLIANG